MRFYILIGPDTIAVRYPSRAHAKHDLARLRKRRVPKINGVARWDNLCISFKGRKYSMSEVHDALVMSITEHFESRLP